MKHDKALHAYGACVNAGINMHRDFHTLSIRETTRLAELAQAFGYRKPRAANGSTARYFYAYVSKGRDFVTR